MFGEPVEIVARLRGLIARASLLPGIPDCRPKVVGKRLRGV